MAGCVAVLRATRSRSASGFQFHREILMLTDTSNSASGNNFISLHWPNEVRYWTRSLGCTEDELRKAVTAVGYSAAEIRFYLADRRPGL